MELAAMIHYCVIGCPQKLNIHLGSAGLKPSQMVLFHVKHALMSFT